MNFQEMGLELKRARESRGLSLDEVVETTKISRRNIVALEEGNCDHLPHPVYAKGFIRSYARLLGLDGEELAMVVDQEMTELECQDPEGYEVTPAADKAFTASEGPATSGKSRWPSILLLVLLLALLVGLIFYFGKMGGALLPKSDEAAVEQPAEQAQAPAVAELQPEPAAQSEMEGAAQPETASQEEVEAAAEVAEETGAQAPEQGVQSAGSSMAEAAGAGEEKPVEAQQAATEVVTAQQPPAEQETVGETEEQESDRQLYAHLLVIRAISDKGCWVGVWKGDEKKMYRDFFLRNGEPLTLKFNSKRRIRIGNVAGVTVRHNGKPFELDDSKGNAQTIVFDVP